MAYEFKVMPFGLCNAPASFQRVMQVVLSGHTRLLLHSGRPWTPLGGGVWTAAQSWKCWFARDSVPYLGHVVSSKGLQVDPKKTEAVQQFPLPISETTLRSFLGLASYYYRFLRGFSKLAQPLFALLQKKNQIPWDS